MLSTMSKGGMWIGLEFIDLSGLTQLNQSRQNPLDICRLNLVCLGSQQIREGAKDVQIDDIVHAAGTGFT